MQSLNFKLVTPERVLYEGKVDSLTCPTEMGEVTILPNHVPLVGKVVPGELSVRANDHEIFMAVGGGVLEVRPKNEVAVLADAGELATEIDLKRAAEARDRAQKLMAEKIMNDEEYAEVTASLERALSRIRVANRKKYKDVGRSTP